MVTRLLSTGIILFWLVMTGLLVQRVWFPEESRLSEVSPRAVFQLFASREKDSQLDIYRGPREIIGSLRAVHHPSFHRGSGLVKFSLDGGGFASSVISKGVPRVGGPVFNTKAK